MGGRRRCRDQDNETRLRRVGYGRKRVRGEDRKRKLLREQRLVHLARRPWAPDEDALERLEAVLPVGASRTARVLFRRLDHAAQQRLVRTLAGTGTHAASPVAIFSLS